MKYFALFALGLFFFALSVPAIGNGQFLGAFTLVMIGIFCWSSITMLAVWIPLFKKVRK